MRVILASLAIAAAAAAPVRAQSGRGSTDSTPPGPPIYTAEQAERGERVYRNSCIECHETLEYTGSEFRSKWNGRPAFELFDLIRTTMPEETPGSLTREQYADVLAYMMKLNAAPAGPTPLPSNDEALKQVKLVIPPPASRRNPTAQATPHPDSAARWRCLGTRTFGSACPRTSPS